MKIRTKLIVAFLLVALVPITLLSVLNQHNLRETLTAAARQSLMGAAAQTADSIDELIVAGLDSVRVESRLPELSHYLGLPPAEQGPDSISYRKTMASLNALSRKSQLFVSSYALLDRSGSNIIDTYAPIKGDDESGWAYFKQALADNLPHVSPVLVTEKMPMSAGIYFSCGIRSATGQAMGVLRIRYRASVLGELLAQSTRHHGGGSLAMLLDEHHFYLAHTEHPEWVSAPAVPLPPQVLAELQRSGRRMAGKLDEPPESLPGLAEGLGSGQQFLTFSLAGPAGDSVDGEPGPTYIAAVAQVSRQPWQVVFARPRSAVLGAINRQLRQTLLLALIVSSGVIALAMIIAQLMARPIVHLRRAAGKVAGGDLNATAVIRSRDEIGELGLAFNRMTGKLRDLIRSMQEGEEALRDSEQRFRQFFELGLVGMAIVSPEGEWIHVNDRLCEILGYEHHELFERTWTELTHDDDRISHRARQQSLLSGEIGSYSSAQRFIKKSGETVFATVSMASVGNDDDMVEYAIALIEDVTERRQAEEEKQRLEERLARSHKMEALGLLAGGVAHDLNNVLSGIVSYPDLILMELPQGSKLREAVQIMQDSGKRAAAIVQDLLTLSRRGVTATELLHLNEGIIADYLRSPEHSQLRIYHPGVRFESRLVPDLLSIRGSPVHLKKTVMNLVANAAEAQPEGGKVVISTENRYVDQPLKGYDDVQEGEYVVLRVEDQGVGISPADLQRIFEPFYTRKVMGRSGTGLGMAVVWGTVQDHNGYIDIQSVEGQGTIFELYFPAIREKVAKKAGEIPLTDYKGAGERILVVDDIADQREIAAQILTMLGYRVDTAASGEDAVAFLQSNRVDLLVLDMIMQPGIDGLETYRRVSKLYPGQKAIIASGFAEDERVKEAQRLGAGRYIQKPYTLEQIGLAVQAELSS
jgi:PAS domain S-box-containing protein